MQIHHPYKRVECGSDLRRSIRVGCESGSRPVTTKPHLTRTQVVPDSLSGQGLTFPFIHIQFCFRNSQYYHRYVLNMNVSPAELIDRLARQCNMIVINRTTTKPFIPNV